ncbi:MAG: hypothetical protein PHZ02_02610 [Desulfocapsaceae bacterium]|nr:hypothetical protein [Desulfocapsaceae bacterium]
MFTLGQAENPINGLDSIGINYLQSKEPHQIPKDERQGAGPLLEARRIGGGTTIAAAADIKIEELSTTDINKKGLAVTKIFGNMGQKTALATAGQI